jgi:cytochrome P450
MFGVENADRYDEFANVATELMHSNTAALMLLPWLRKGFGGIGPWARLIRLRARFDELLAAEVDARRSDTSDRTVFGALLAGSHATALDPEDLHQQLRTLVVAGHDTTAGALTWALYHIHREPRIRERVMAELDGASGPESLPQLPYLTAVVSEALRMHPAVPIVMRRLTAPLTVDGVRYSPGDVLGIAVPAVHFDPAHWPDPHRFDPDRFFDKTPTPFEYCPLAADSGAAPVHRSRPTSWRSRSARCCRRPNLRCDVVSSAVNHRDRCHAASPSFRGVRCGWTSPVDCEPAWSWRA